MEIKYHHFSYIDSTNAFAKRESKRFSDDYWTAITADTQTDGRGQNDTDWIDFPKGSLLMTIISPNIKWDNSRIMNAHMSASLGIKNFLVDNGFDAKLKWPNDIYIGSGKVAGILSEAIWQGSFCNRFFFGLGMNIRNAPEGCDWEDLSTGELFKARTTRVCKDGRLELTLISGEVRIFANKEVKILT